MFNVGDKIVYPMHGAGTIDAIEEKDILGEKQAYYIIKMPGEVKVMVPTAKAEEIGKNNPETGSGVRRRYQCSKNVAVRRSNCFYDGCGKWRYRRMEYSVKAWGRSRKKSI